MSGNVFEYVWDEYGDYPTEVVTNPLGPTEGARWVSGMVRGGSFQSTLAGLRVAARFHPASPEGVGIRLVKPCG
jgi:formylglycine-generating enzyme required for sulfatase activity